MAPPSADDASALLRAASTPAQRDAAISAALDRLAATSSVPETQRLLDALTTHAALPVLLPRLQQVASVCTAPPRKAECVGRTLVDVLVAHVADSADARRGAQHALLAVFQANASVVGGVRTALERVSLPTDDDDGRYTTTALAVARPLLVVALVAPCSAAPRRAVQQLALVQSLVRVAWASASTVERRALVADVLARAVALAPLATDADAWSVYPALVAAATDLLVESRRADPCLGAVAHAVVRRVVFGLTHGLGVVALLQSLLEIAAAWPQALGTSSSLVWQLGAVLLHEQAATREQTLVLRILGVLLPVATAVKPTRRVFVEALVVPLVAVQATHPQDAPPLLQRVLDAAASGPFQRTHDDHDESPALGVEAAHGASFLALAASAHACEAWLDSLFHDETPEIQDASSALLMQIGACLVDRRGAVRSLALDALDRQLRHRRTQKSADWSAASVKLLVSTLVVLTSYRPATSSPSDATWLGRGFQVLATVAATTTETMKIALRLIKRMAATSTAPSLQPQALHLMLLTWKQDSRVYPQLENLLNQAKEAADEREDDNEDTEADIVRMGTILAMCEKDPETGVEWIADVQAFLEHPCVSIVAMAVRAVTVLCIADCLDYETTVKMFVVKLKKNKIECAEESLFQQELCKLYAFGGTCDFVECSPKYSARVLSDLWQYAEAEDADVRFEAFVALNGYTLEALGLRLDDTTAARGQENEDEDEDDEALTEQDVEENVDRVWVYLHTEGDDRVRVEVESLVKKILDAESKKLAPGGASRTGTNIASAASFAALEQRVSAAASKELRKVLPTRDSLVAQLDETTEWRAYLLAYEPANVLESGAAAKRRDKRLRAVMGHVDEMKAILNRCLSASTAALAGGEKDSSPQDFLGLLQSVDAWNSFARKYFGRLEELAVLRTPMDAPVGHTAGVLSNLIDEEVLGLTFGDLNTHTQRWLVVGAIVHQACLSTSADSLEIAITTARTLLRTQLQQTLEELRVFKDSAHAVDLQHLLLGLALACPTEFDPHLEAIVARVLPIVTSEGSIFARAASILFVSHASSLFRKDETRAIQRQRIQSGIECIMAAMLRTTYGDTASGFAAKIFTQMSDFGEVAGQLKASSAARTSASTVLAWASAMGLTQLSQRLAAVHCLTWLDNIRLLLEHVWQADPTLCGAIALGPVLLESVHHNRISTTEVLAFTSTLQRRLDDAPSDTTVIGAIVLPYVMQQIGAYGCACSRSDVDAFLHSLERGQGSASASILSVAGANLLHGTTGVTTSGTATLPQREVTVETASVERLVAALHELHKQAQGESSTTAVASLAAIADRADSFYVSQKNKTFDVQVNTLPATSLVFKALEFLRLGTPVSGIKANSIKRVSRSVLSCVAHASHMSPLPLDLAALAIRVASRYAKSDEVLAACIDLAASHASGVSLLMANFMSPVRLLNYSPPILERCVDALSTTCRRLTPQQVVVLVTRTFESLVEFWLQDGSCSITSTAFENWVKLVGSLVESPLPKPGEIAAADDSDDGAISLGLAALVQNQFVTRLPFTPDQIASTMLLRQFARDVLSKITPRNAVVDVLVASARTPKSGDNWAWWRAGVTLCELLRIGAISSSSVVFRWLLQFDFSVVENDPNAVDAFLADLADAVCVAAGKKSVIDVNEPWLLELLDAIARTTDDSQTSAFKRHFLFAAVENVLSWTEMRSHELLVLRRDAADVGRATIVASLPALGARALLSHHHERSNASAAITQRLWTLQTDGEREADARDVFMRELYVTASEVRPPLLSNDIERTFVAQLSSA